MLSQLIFAFVVVVVKLRDRISIYFFKTYSFLIYLKTIQIFITFDDQQFE